MAGRGLSLMLENVLSDPSGGGVPEMGWGRGRLVLGLAAACITWLVLLWLGAACLMYVIFLLTILPLHTDWITVAK